MIFILGHAGFVRLINYVNSRHAFSDLQIVMLNCSDIITRDAGNDVGVETPELVYAAWSTPVGPPRGIII